MKHSSSEAVPFHVSAVQSSWVDGSLSAVLPEEAAAGGALLPCGHSMLHPGSVRQCGHAGAGEIRPQVLRDQADRAGWTRISGEDKLL